MMLTKLKLFVFSIVHYAFVFLSQTCRFLTFKKLSECFSSKKVRRRYRLSRFGEH